MQACGRVFGYCAAPARHFSLFLLRIAVRRQLLDVAAALLAGVAGVAGQLDAINGEHVSANQTLGIAGEQYLCEQGTDLAAEFTDEFGQCGELGCAVTGQGHEEDVLAAGALDASARYQAAAIGQQDDLEQDCGVVGGSAGCIVVVAGMQTGEVKFMVNQIVQRVLEAARLDLRVQHYGDELWGAINQFVAGHDNIRI